MAKSKSTEPTQPPQPQPQRGQLIEPWQLEDAIGSYYEAIAELRRRYLQTLRYPVR